MARAGNNSRPTKDLFAYLVMKSSALNGLDAYRAELEGPAGKVVIWANVTAAGYSVELKDGGENIGLCVTPALFDGPARPFIASAIRRTMNLGTETVARLLDEISEAMLH